LSLSHEKLEVSSLCFFKRNLCRYAEVLVAHMDKINALFNAPLTDYSNRVNYASFESASATAAPVLRAWRRYRAMMFPHLHEVGAVYTSNPADP
jgi:hypothetical protein